MKNVYLILLLAVGVVANAQSVDYNTDGGYIADGYDVVAYHNNHPKKGNSKFETTFDSVKFKFSSQENLDTFNSDPKKYVPQYGGWCSYAMATAGEKVSIDPKTYAIRDGKLFLFYNSWGTNTYKSWIKSPDDFIDKADINWEKVKFKK